MDIDVEGTVNQCINQTVLLMSRSLQQVPDWVVGLEGKTVTCADVTIRLRTSIPILEECLTATCAECENGKSICSIGGSQPSITPPTRIQHIHPATVIQLRGLQGLAGFPAALHACGLQNVLWCT